MHLGIFKQSPVRDRLRSCAFKPGDTDTGTGDWGDCSRCGLARTRRRVSLKRFGGSGKVKLLFINDAPGQGEDKTGIPLIGIDGKILHNIIRLSHIQFEYAITNLVCCRPVNIVLVDEDKQEDDLSELSYGVDYIYEDWDREPNKGEISACRSHIEEIIDHYQPEGIVYLGKTATAYQTKLPSIMLKHPNDIAKLEYKLITAKQEADKLDELTLRLYHANHDPHYKV